MSQAFLKELLFYICWRFNYLHMKIIGVQNMAYNNFTPLLTNLVQVWQIICPQFTEAKTTLNWITEQFLVSLICVI